MQGGLSTMTWGSAKTVASDKQSMALTVTGQGQVTSAMVLLISCSSSESDSCVALLSILLFGAAAVGAMGSGVRRDELIGVGQVPRRLSNWHNSYRTCL